MSAVSITSSTVQPIPALQSAKALAPASSASTSAAQAAAKTSDSASAPVKTVQASPPVQINISTSKGSTATAAQEAAETQDVTSKEAAKGDQQAIKLLAKETAAQPQSGKSQVNIKA